MEKFRLPSAILWSWLICGTLDISAACIDVGVNYGKSPLWLLQNVAGALLGPQSYQLGLPTAVLGLMMHFTVALTVTTIFYLLGQRFPALRRQAIPAALLYSVVVFLVMYRVTLPLTIELRSRYLTTPFNHAWPALRWSQLLVHLLCIGLPLGLVTRHFATDSEPARARQ